MKRLYHILIAALLLVTSCIKMEPVAVTPTIDGQKDIKVPIAFDLLVPSDGTSTKAMADEPEIDHISVAVFGGSGFFNEWIVAGIDNVEEVNYDGTPETKYSIRVNLTMSDSRLRLHFIANGPVDAPLTGQPAKDSEDGMMGRLTSQLAWEHNDGYWQKVVLPLGVHAQTWLNTDNNPPTVEYWKDPDTGQYVPTEETVEQFPDPIKMVRNFARIKVQLATGSDLTAISRIALAYAPMEGTFAPMMSEAVTTDEYGIYTPTETEYLDRYVPGYSDLSMEALKAAPYNYKGYFPAAIQLGGYGEDKSRPYPETDAEMEAWSADKYLYVYERTIPTTSRPATRLVIKATHRTDGVKYYRIDLHEGGANYPLLRNYTYIVSIGNVAAGTGRDNPKDAAESPSTSDISAEVTDLPQVSDGIAQIAVEYIEQTYVEGGQTHTLDFQFIPLLSDDETVDNSKVSFKLGSGVGNEFVENGTSGNGPAIDGTPTITATGPNEGWGRITYTLTNNNANKFQTIRVIGTKNDGSTVYRDVVIYLKMKQVMTVECLDKYVEEKVGEQERVRVYIPGDLSRSMFPLAFQVEPTSYALNPDGQNMPVNSGKSLSGNGKSVFYFIRTLTWEDYQTLPSLPGDSRKYFECDFKTTKEQNAGRVYVANSYFLNGADDVSGNWDEYFNYTKRYFTGLMFSAKVSEDEDVNFLFTMDAAHTGSDKVLPGVVTVKLVGLEPKSGYSDLVPVEGKADVYLFEPAAPSATFQLTATSDTYSVTLSTEDDTNPILYDVASRTSSDPVPEVTGIIVSPATASVRIGTTTTLTATLSGTAVSDFPVEWESSNPSVATVDGNGVVTGVTLGTATITAKAGGKEATSTVSVVNTVEVTIPESAWAKNNGNNQRTYISGIVTAVFSSARGRGTYIQMSNNSNLTISTSGNKRITSIVITTTSGSLTLYSAEGNYSNGTWTGSSTSVVFRGNAAITSITISHEP